MLEHPAYSPDLAPSDFFLFPKIKEILKGRYFNDLDDIRSNTMANLKAISQNQFQNCFEGWTRRWHRCIASQGEYFESDHGSIQHVVVSISTYDFTFLLLPLDSKKMSLFLLFTTSEILWRHFVTWGMLFCDRKFCFILLAIFSIIAISVKWRLLSLQVFVSVFDCNCTVNTKTAHTMLWGMTLSLILILHDSARLSLT